VLSSIALATARPQRRSLPSSAVNVATVASTSSVATVIRLISAASTDPNLSPVTKQHPPAGGVSFDSRVSD
jgi:hypothetical protein